MSRVLIDPFRFGASSAPNLTALFVVGDATALTAGETAIQTHLTGTLGLTVTLMSDEADPGGYSAYSVIVVGDSCALANVGKFAGVATGLVSYLSVAGAADALDIMDTTGVIGGLTRTAMTVVTTAHPITAAFASGAEIQVFSVGSALNHMYPDEANTTQQTTRLGRNSSYATTWSLYAGNAGEVGAGGAARAGRRVQMFFRDAGIANLTANGWTLFSNAVQWARGQLS